MKKEETDQKRMPLRKETEEIRKMILVVSFGTSHPDARRKAIGGIEKAIERQFPDHILRRCFTSQRVIRIVEQREGIHIDSLREALEKACEDQINHLLIQPTHVLAGIEYKKLLDTAGTFQDRFDKLCVGLPLLWSERDYADLVRAIAGCTKEFIDGRTAVVLVGHGTRAEADAAYRKCQTALGKEGLADHFVGTVESRPSKEDIAGVLLEKKKYRRVILLPLMVVAGDHAVNDISGAGQSWRRVLEDAGFEVRTVLRGLGEYPEVQSIYVEHLREADADPR